MHVITNLTHLHHPNCPMLKHSISCYIFSVFRISHPLRQFPRTPGKNWYLPGNTGKNWEILGITGKLGSSYGVVCLQNAVIFTILWIKSNICSTSYSPNIFRKKNNFNYEFKIIWRPINFWIWKTVLVLSILFKNQLLRTQHIFNVIANFRKV